MATNDKVILGIDIEGLSTLNEYKAALAEIREKKADLNVTDEEFTTLAEKEAKVLAMQKDALNKTKSAVIATEGSFNALNQKLAGLKEQWKATGDAVERAKLTEQINGVKDQLNAMNESIGNFQHNVGNYANAMEQVFGGAISSVIGELENVNTTLNVLKANPMMLILAAAVGVIMGIVKAIKSSEGAMQRVNALLAPMRALSDAVLNVLQSVADNLLSVFESVAGWIGKVMERLGKTFPKIAELNEKAKEAIELQKVANKLEKETRDNAVKNAQDQLKIAELKAQAKDKEKFTNEERLEFIREANKLEEQMSKRNLEEAEKRLKIAEEEAARAENTAETEEELAQLKIATYNARREYQAKLRELKSEELSILNEIRAEEKKKEDEEKKRLEEQAKAREKEIEEQKKQAEAKRKAEEQAEKERLKMLEEQRKDRERIAEEELKAEQARAQKRKDIVMASVQAVSGVLSALADIYESNGEADEKAQKKAKGIRIAAAVIDMLQGAVTAYASAQQLGPIAGPIIGGINAAAVIATGSANIAKMKSTDTSGKSTPNTSGIGATVSAPAVIQQIPVTRSLTGASEDERLNQIAQNTARDQRVVLVYSDVEAAGRRVEVQNAETSF